MKLIPHYNIPGRGMQSPQVTNEGVCTGSTVLKGEGPGIGKSGLQLL